MWPFKPSTPNTVHCFLIGPGFFFCLSHRFVLPLTPSAFMADLLKERLYGDLLAVRGLDWWSRVKTIIKRVCCGQIGLDKHAAHKVSDRNVCTRENIPLFYIQTMFTSVLSNNTGLFLVRVCLKVRIVCVVFGLSWGVLRHQRFQLLVNL